MRQRPIRNRGRLDCPRGDDVLAADRTAVGGVGDQELTSHVQDCEVCSMEARILSTLRSAESAAPVGTDERALLERVMEEARTRSARVEGITRRYRTRYLQLAAAALLMVMLPVGMGLAGAVLPLAQEGSSLAWQLVSSAAERMVARVGTGGLRDALACALPIGILVATWLSAAVALIQLLRQRRTLTQYPVC